MNRCILLMRGHGLISATIRWQTRCWASHAALYVGGGNVIEAWPSKVRLNKQKSWENVKALTNPALGPDDWDRVEKTMRSQIGKKYDYGAVLRFLSWQRDKDSDNDKWFCFELLHYALRRAGFPVVDIADCRVHGGHFEASIDWVEVPLPT